MSVLVTGGFGYIGSHTCVELLNAGYEVVIVDNLRNSYRMVQQRIQKITGKKLRFYEVDLLDYHALEYVFEKENIEAVIHFAGLKSVPESMKHPLLYYRNVEGSLNLCKVMEQFQVKRLIFSSTAAVYDHGADCPLKETSGIEPASPYGETKLALEHMFESVCQADSRWKVIILRYFNPVGAHSSAEIGEMPRKESDNLIPRIMEVAAGKQAHVNIYGADYDTCDGTCVRDYVHVSDLALGHVRALEHLAQTTACTVYNLGTGRGYSVLQIIDVCRKISGKDIPYKICSRRQGDVPVSFCHPQKAKEELGWSAGYGIEDMVSSAWEWRKRWIG